MTPIFADPPPKKDGFDFGGHVLRSIQEIKQDEAVSVAHQRSIQASQTWITLILVVLMVVMIIKTLFLRWLYIKHRETEESLKERELLFQRQEETLRLVKGYFELALRRDTKAAETLDTVKAQSETTKAAVDQIKEVVKTAASDSFSGTELRTPNSGKVAHDQESAI